MLFLGFVNWLGLLFGDSLLIALVYGFDCFYCVLCLIVVICCLCVLGDGVVAML